MPTNSCYVYLHLQKGFVPVGKLTMRQNGEQLSSEFAYGRRYLERPNALSIDPRQLPLTSERFQTLGLFGCFRDASPDGWGRHLLGRAAEEHGTHPSEFEYLTVLDQQNRIGALAFGMDLSGPKPYTPAWRPKRIAGDGLDLQKMLEAADAVMNYEELKPEYRRFLVRGSSVGGAQPKATLEFEGRPWIAKFSQKLESWPTCRIELAAMRLAAACGIRTAASRLVHVAGGRDILLSERFDRAPNGNRLPYLTAMSLTGVPEMHMGSYGDIARSMRRFCDADTLSEDLAELFRRMVFNILCNNTDDHQCNHAFLYSFERRTWRLSPAYDVVPQPLFYETGPSRLTLGVGESGTLATLPNALSHCEDFLLTKEQARGIVRNMHARVHKHWQQVNQDAGVPEEKLPALAQAYHVAASPYEE
ncbi:type II toxin-antitoxin system HipA family toxin [Desulfobaculum bizertense]|uniref:type II toxin-antitoxin system HipA family toxin n=1 Tax=Desulfobaculum bizertense TaxID=376490 RepID=UPI001F24A498|nr:type II toxin-antitoxin system HipA family toxin [Desulfobaculum bizertense]UIJ39190.1 type II toxin-antitoxin system HipA family toxin [Desulfobaculum bizertense]